MASPAAGSGGGADPDGGRAARAAAARAEAEIERAIAAPVGDPEEALLAYGEHLTEEKWMELWGKIVERKNLAALGEKYLASVEGQKQVAQQRLDDVRERRSRLLEELFRDANPADRKSKMLELADLDAEEEQALEGMAVFAEKEKVLDVIAEKEAEAAAAEAAAMAPVDGGHGAVPAAAEEPEGELSADKREENKERIRDN